MTHNYPDNLRCCRTASASYRSGWARGHEYIAPVDVTVPDHDADPHRFHHALGFIDGNTERCATLTTIERRSLNQ